MNNDTINHSKASGDSHHQGRALSDIKESKQVVNEEISKWVDDIFATNNINQNPGQLANGIKEYIKKFSSNNDSSMEITDYHNEVNNVINNVNKILAENTKTSNSATEKSSQLNIIKAKELVKSFINYEIYEVQTPRTISGVTPKTHERNNKIMHRQEPVGKHHGSGFGVGR